jgi:copper chaperone CopZ
VDSNAVNQSATITFDDTKTNVEAIKKALARAGYPPLGNPEVLK